MNFNFENEEIFLILYSMKKEKDRLKNDIERIGEKNISDEKKREELTEIYDQDFIAMMLLNMDVDIARKIKDTMSGKNQEACQLPVLDNPVYFG